MDLNNFFKKQKRNNLTEFESRQVLEKYKIRLVRSSLVKNEEEAVTAAKKIGYPVVLKIVSPDIIHKTDAGGIAVDIKDEQELLKAFGQINKNVKKKFRKARIHGFLVQKMIKDGQQVIVGGKRDSQFGQTIMFGLGGIFTEVFEDVSFRVCPVNRADAEEMIKEIKGYKILKSYRGKAYYINGLVEMILKASKMLEENKKIRELDINPVIVSSKEAVAVDARIVVG
jgi:acyl-CoA synthetase (NDP forming)